MSTASPSPSTPQRAEEATVPPRVLRLRAYLIATFTPSAEEDEVDGSGVPFCLEVGSTLQQVRPVILAMS